MALLPHSCNCPYCPGNPFNSFAPPANEMVLCVECGQKYPVLVPRGTGIANSGTCNACLVKRGS